MYRKFLVEAMEVLGSYDGRKVEIERGSTSSLEVATHESIHERIFHETLDGVLHRLVIARADREKDKNFEARSDFLMDETKLAHEAAATYLGVQALDSLETRAQTFASLPPEYVGYYKVMADVITPLTSSTYLAFSLGWSLAYWAFQSDRLFTIFDKGWDSFEATIARIASPTERMLSGVRMLQVVGPAWLAAGLEAASRAYHGTATTPWDVHDDDAWRSQPLTEVGRLEAHLSAGLWKWLRDNAPIPSANSDDYPEGFTRWLFDGLDVPKEQRNLIVKDDAFDSDPANEGILAATKAMRAGKATISNSSTERIDRVRTRDHLDRRKAIARLESFSPAIYYVGSATPTGRKGWCVYIYKRGAQSTLPPGQSELADRFIVAEDFAIEILGRLKAARTDRASSASLFMVPADADLLPHYANKLRPLLAGLTPGGDQANVETGSAYPLWYWTDDWLNILSEPGTATAGLRLEPVGTELDEAYILHIARATDVPGYLFRLTSRMVGQDILRFEDTLKAEGRLSAIPEGEAQRVVRGLSGYVRIILENWYVF